MKWLSTLGVILGLAAFFAFSQMNTGAKAETTAAAGVNAAGTQDRRIADGVVRGRLLQDGSSIYTSIPYAAPPVGALRWKPPQPVVPWSGVYVADTPKPCLQLDEGWNTKDVAISSEDCLYLSIHEPRQARGAKLPVFVWIHGGSNRAGDGFGTADSSLYQHGIVVVGIEYRLGVFGFLASSELASESPEHSSGNYALLDEIAALQWVKRNIRAFGGDPDNVTIGGQSAGGFDVEFLQRSPLAQGLFTKAIEESAALGGQPRTEAENERLGADLIARTGAPPGPNALPFLRAAPGQGLMAAARALEASLGQRPLWMEPAADGWVLRGRDNDLYASAPLARVPRLVGTVAREFAVDAPDEAVRQIVRQSYGRNAEPALAFYGLDAGRSPSEDPILGEVGTQVVTDLLFRCPSIEAAHWAVGSNHKVWRYRFGIARPGLTELAHNAELDYVFNSSPANAAPGSWPPLQSYWANFIKTGDPNGAGLAAWPEMGPQDRFVDFTAGGPVAQTETRGAVCDLLAGTHAPGAH